MNVTAVGLGDFTKEVLKSKEPVLVDFWASYCAPCRNLKPILATVAAKGVKVVTVDIEAEPELTGFYQVASIPTLVVFKDGKAGNRVVGLKSSADLLELVRAA